MLKNMIETFRNKGKKNYHPFKYLIDLRYYMKEAHCAPKAPLLAMRIIYECCKGLLGVYSFEGDSKTLLMTF